MRTSLLLPLVAAALLVSACATHTIPGAPTQVLVPVIYATNRSVDGAASVENPYGEQPAAAGFGRATVALSVGKHSDSAFADWSRWQGRSDDARNRDELIAIQPMSRGAQFDALAARSLEDPAKPVLLYVHGYRKSFEEASIDCAILAYNLNLDGTPLLYTWPSVDSLLDYRADARNLEASIPELRDYLAGLMRATADGQVHVIAHSLGALGFLSALESLVSGGVDLSGIGEIILVSPDIDTEAFEDRFLPILNQIVARKTLYATENDVPLLASRVVNNGKRLGDARAGIYAVTGMDTVVVSEVVNFYNGHDSHLVSGDVQADLHYLIVRQLPAAGRPTLVPSPDATNPYWRIRTAD